MDFIYAMKNVPIEHSRAVLPNTNTLSLSRES